MRCLHMEVASVASGCAALLLLAHLAHRGEATLQRSQVDLSVLEFDVHDILNERLIPLSMISQQLQAMLVNGTHKNNASLAPPTWLSLRMGSAVNSSDLNAAFVAMKYHRRMINEFLATDYVAQQILNAPPAQWGHDFMSIGKRMGAAPNTNTSDPASDRQPRVHAESNNHKLLEDEGMTRYKSWLEKTITLEDIQRQLEEKNAVRKDEQTARRSPGAQRRQAGVAEPPVDDKDDDEGDFEDGELTGYALTTTPNDYFQSQSSANHQYWPHAVPISLPNLQTKGHFEQSINKNGNDAGYEDYGGHPAPYVHPQPVHPAPTEPPKPSKEISLKDITDIALTTLAFLSFGMFILQVLMCITMGKEDSSMMAMLPMEATDAPDLPGETEEIRRKRRSASPEHNRRLNDLNELARRVLFSIDAVLDQRNEGCHFWSLCENNRFAKKQVNGQKFWIPVWSLGLSWFTTRVHRASSKSTDYISIMNSLKAVAIGLGGGECNYYCDIGNLNH